MCLPSLNWTLRNGSVVAFMLHEIYRDKEASARDILCCAGLCVLPIGAGRVGSLLIYHSRWHVGLPPAPREEMMKGETQGQKERIGLDSDTNHLGVGGGAGRKTGFPTSRVPETFSGGVGVSRTRPSGLASPLIRHCLCGTLGVHVRTGSRNL